MKPDKYFSLLVLFFIPILLSCADSSTPARSIINFGENWKFYLGDADGAWFPEFDDRQWRTLDVPHDWSIEGDFSKDHPSSPGGGALPGGIGWYRKSFVLAEEDKDKQVFIDFDGVYQKSEVWINGQYLGMRPYGYISFRYDLTPYLNYGESGNLVAVKVDNHEQPNSRWYSGSGIYRNVWMIKTGKVHVDHWGTYITTPEVNKSKALISFGTTVVNKQGTSVNAELRTTIYDPSGKKVAFAKAATFLEAGDKGLINQNLEVRKPGLWDIDHPQLYKAISEVYAGSELVDHYETTFGIRYFEFDPYQGFSLNGRKVKLLGVCQHHDLGCLGAAVNVRRSRTSAGDP
jgi:beta-galactosidase